MFCVKFQQRHETGNESKEYMNELINIDCPQFHFENIHLYCCDCMDLMAQLPDKSADLAITDPPYGGGQHFNFRYGIGTEVYENHKPPEIYWDGLFRISANQIVWGGNYFAHSMPENRCWISWYKGNPLDSFSDFELAWTSFDKVARAVKMESYGFNHKDGTTIHPTQKPVATLKQLIELFTDKGDVVIDPVAGSGSTLVAAIELERKAYGFEIKKDYFKAASEWISTVKQRKADIEKFGYAKTEINKTHNTLF